MRQADCHFEVAYLQIPKSAPARFLAWTASNMFALCALIFGVMLRSIPEIWAGPSLIGFDTVYYAGEFSRLGSCLGLLNQPGEIILGLFACPIVPLAGPIITMKITPIIIYGFFGWSVFYFSGKELRQTPATSFFVVTFVLLQIAALRISWDLYHNLIALSLFLLLLGSLTGLRGKTRFVVVAALAFLVAMAHQLVMGLLLMVGVGLIMWALLKCEPTPRAKLLGLLISLVLLTAVSSFLIFPTTLSEILGTAYSVRVATSTTALALGTFLGALYLPSVVPAIVGLRKVRSLVVWTLEISLILLLSVSGLPYLAVFMDRWSLMLVVPLGVFGALGLVSLARRMVHRCERIGFVAHRAKTIQGFMLLALLIPYGGLAWEFMTSPISRPYWYFYNPVLWRAGASGLPATMLHNTVPFEDELDVQSAFRWLNHIMTNSDVLLTHPAFYGWALLYLRRDRAIINYGGFGPNYGVLSARQAGFQHEYVIWFIPGYTWHEPDPNLTGWALVFKDGPIVVYLTS